MLDFLKQKDRQPMDVKTIRNKLVQFIKDQLQRTEGGEGSNIKSLDLYISPLADDRHLYETAVYNNEPDRFRYEEVQRIADDYDIALSPSCPLSIIFDELPAAAVHSKELPVALHIATKKKPSLNTPSTAYLRVLTGEAEEEQYVLTSEDGRICIGRDREVQTSDGFFRINRVAFPVNSRNEANKYVSRQHAHIEWNEENGSFVLYADEGGVPPRNKVKVQTVDGSLIKLQTIQLGHRLREGDQIMLGDSAVLQFSYGNKGR